MLENERLMDRYEKIREENPNRKWTDPLDLYYKVHYDLDAPEEEKDTSESHDELGEMQECHGYQHDETDDYVKDDVREIPVYRLAFNLVMCAMDYAKHIERAKSDQDPLLDEFMYHALRIPADISGGHGMGYEEDFICGNIVKNRWALAHAKSAQGILNSLIERDINNHELAALLAQLPPLIKTLDERISQLRAKVWWGKNDDCAN